MAVSIARTGVLLAALCLAPCAAADEVVLKDGSILCTKKPYAVKGRLATFTLCTDDLVSYPADQIDLEKTRLARENPAAVTLPPNARWVGYPPPKPVYDSGGQPAPASVVRKPGAPAAAPGTITMTGSSSAAGSSSTASSSSAATPLHTVYVGGYTRANGTHVSGYTRAAPGSGSGHSSGGGRSGGGKH